VGVAQELQPKDGPPADPPEGRNADSNFHGQKRSNKTHASTTDPESRLYRKSLAAPAKLGFMGHTLMEHRNVGACGCLSRHAAARRIILPSDPERRARSSKDGDSQEGH
jgi:hypothetical protein